TFSATKLNDAASIESRINSIVSGATQVGSSTMLWVPSGLVTMDRQPAIAPSRVAVSVWVLRPNTTCPGSTAFPSTNTCTCTLAVAMDVSLVIFLLLDRVCVNKPTSKEAPMYRDVELEVLMVLYSSVCQPVVPVVSGI